MNIIFKQMSGREKGKSKSAIARHWLMTNEPEKYQQERDEQRDRERLRTEKRREHWDSGTRAAAEDKEEFMARRR